MPQTKRKKVKGYSYLFILGFGLLLAFLAYPSPSFADYVDTSWTISPDGLLTVNTMPSTCGGVVGTTIWFSTFYGTYPTGTEVAPTGMQTCVSGSHTYNFAGTLTNDGNYFIGFGSTRDSTDTYFPFNINGGVFTPLSTADIIFSSPTIGGTSTNSVTFSGTFQNGAGYNNILIFITTDSTTLGTYLIPITGDSGTFNQIINIPDGNYHFVTRFYNSTNYLFGDWYPAENSLAWPFFVNNYIIPATCDTLDIACYIKNSLTYLFIPNFSAFDRYTDLKNTLEVKPPFGYITGIYTSLGTLTNSNNPAFTLESVSSINDLIFTPMRTALVWILWFAFAFVLFLRFRDLQI